MIFCARYYRTPKTVILPQGVGQHYHLEEGKTISSLEKNYLEHEQLLNDNDFFYLLKI